jgi:hypothetical protein
MGNFTRVARTADAVVTALCQHAELAGTLQVATFSWASVAALMGLVYFCMCHAPTCSLTASHVLVPTSQVIHARWAMLGAAGCIAPEVLGAAGKQLGSS